MTVLLEYFDPASLGFICNSSCYSDFFLTHFSFDASYNICADWFLEVVYYAKISV